MINRKYYIYIIIYNTLAFTSPEETSGLPIFLHGQSALNPYYLWQEISHDHIMNDYFMPLIESDLKWNSLNRYYYRENLFASTHTFLRFEPNLIGRSDRLGIRQIINGMVVVELSRSLIIQNNFEFDSEGWDDLHFLKGSKITSMGDWTGYLQHSSLTFFYKKGHFLAGRGNLYTSVLGNSLLINPIFPPVEYFWWHHERDRLVYDWSISFLDPTDDQYRFLSLHRYGYQTVNWRIGFSELAMVRYENWGAKEMNFCLPASVLFETEFNGGNNSNLMWAIDVIGKLYDHTISGEILIDDVAIDGKSPPKIAFKIGIGSVLPYFDYYFEYSRVNRWTGNFYYSGLRYVENDILIGHPIGPDAHSATVKLFKVIHDKLFIQVDFKWLESGSGDIDEWPEGVGASSNFGWSHEPFPSRPIVTTFQSTTNFGYYYKNLNIDLEWSISNQNRTFLKMSIYYAI